MLPEIIEAIRKNKPIPTSNNLNYMSKKDDKKKEDKKPEIKGKKSKK